MRVAGQTGFPGGRSRRAARANTVRAGDEVEAALMTRLVLVLTNQIQAGGEVVVAAERHLELMPLRNTGQRVLALRLNDTDLGAESNRTIAIQQTSHDGVHRRTTAR